MSPPTQTTLQSENTTSIQEFSTVEPFTWGISEALVRAKTWFIDRSRFVKAKTTLEQYPNISDEELFNALQVVGKQAASLLYKRLVLETENQKAAFLWLNKAVLELQEYLPGKLIYPGVARYTRIIPKPMTREQCAATGYPYHEDLERRPVTVTHGCTHLFARVPEKPATLITVSTHIPNTIYMLITLVHELTHLVGDGITDHGEGFARAIGHTGIEFGARNRHVLTPKTVAIFEGVLEKIGPFPGTFVYHDQIDEFFASHYKVPTGYDISPHAIRRRGGATMVYDLVPNTRRVLDVPRPTP
jgi:hypothetical protein